MKKKRGGREEVVNISTYKMYLPSRHHLHQSLEKKYRERVAKESTPSKREFPPRIVEMNLQSKVSFRKPYFEFRLIAHYLVLGTDSDGNCAHIRALTFLSLIYSSTLHGGFTYLRQVAENA